MASEKKITRAYKAKLTRKERKVFRSQMWLFRREEKELSAKDQAELTTLFERIPQLRSLYDLRLRFKAIFDTLTRRQASLALTKLYLDAQDAFPGLEKVVCTCEHWQPLILNYFPDRRTSAAVEGINNKARVITKRAYGLKSAESLWTRLVLDLNRAQEIVFHTIAGIRTLAHGFRAAFSMVCS